MAIGVPKEVKDHENRVALTPRSVASLVSAGNKVVVEAGSGSRSGFSDDEYASAGAAIAGSAAELYLQADLIVKVKEIQVGKGEHKHLRQGHVIFGFNHFESSKELTEAAVKSKATFISFEKVIDSAGQTPLLMPMSKIAGAMSGIWAGFFHNFAFKHDKAIRLKTGADEIKSKFIGQFERVMDVSFDGDLKRTLSLQDKTAVIFGGGSVGEMAAKICSALGAKIIMIEKREARRKYLQELNLPKCSVIESADSDVLRSAYVIIGSTYDKEKADRVIDEKLLKEISEVRKKIIIDVAVDQGGNFTFIDPSGKYSPSSTGSILTPAQVDYFGNTFIRVPNIPSIVPKYASSALSSMIAEYVKSLANGAQKPELAKAVSIKDGKIIDEAIVRAHNLK